MTDQDKLKALDLIINKSVSIKWLKILVKQPDINYALSLYNDQAGSNKLTLDEFKFLLGVVA